MIAGHAALLAWKSGRPVKMVYDRAEDMAATTKRHPSRTRHRTACRRRRPAASRWTSTSSSTAAPTARCRRWCCRAARFTPPGRTSARTCASAARAVATNAPPHGAFRGFGAPQSLFALERHMDRVAAAARPHARGAPPPQLHHARPDQRGRAGDLRAGRHGRRCSIARSSCPDYHEKRARFARENDRRARAAKGSASRRSCTAPGFTGSGEDHLASVVDVEGARGRPRARARGEHRDRPGHEHDLRADRRRRAGLPTRRHRGRAARHRRRAQQRPDGGLAHLHGRRQAGRDGGARDCSALLVDASLLGDAVHRRRLSRAPCQRYLATHRAAARPRRSTSRRPGCAGTTTVPGRRLRHVRLGGVRRRGHGRH